MTKLEELWADPRFQLLIDINKVLEGNRIWGGMSWHYNPIHPFMYLPLIERVDKALDDVQQEYGIYLKNDGVEND